MTSLKNIIESALSWSLSSFPKLVLPQNIHTTGQWLKFVETNDLYTCIRHCSFKNLEMHLSALICRDAFWHTLRIWVLKFSLSSRVTPDIFNVLFGGIEWPPTLTRKSLVGPRDNKMLWNLCALAVVWFLPNQLIAVIASLSMWFFSISKFSFSLHIWLSSA